MLNHISFGCVDLKAATSFYDAVLAPLGYIRVWSAKDGSGYGLPGNDDGFAIKKQDSVVPPKNGFHLAFSAPTRGAVDAFYKEALEHGGQDNGTPGLRPHYGPNYYAAFVTDLDGYAIEAVCHMSE